MWSRVFGEVRIRRISKGFIDFVLGSRGGMFYDRRGDRGCIFLGRVLVDLKFGRDWEENL